MASLKLHTFMRSRVSEHKNDGFGVEQRYKGSKEYCASTQTANKEAGSNQPLPAPSCQSQFWRPVVNVH